MESNLDIKIERVTFGLYTWRLQVGTTVTIGFGTKDEARAAGRTFILKNGGVRV